MASFNLEENKNFIQTNSNFNSLDKPSIMQARVMGPVVNRNASMDYLDGQVFIPHLLRVGF